MQYLHRDHLGSIDKITDASGNILQTLAFEPFGSRKDSDWQQNIEQAELDDVIANLNIRTAKGFTGHEHLDRTGFIHMNGRVYDPTLGRFLSPDPVVQAPTNSQSWNRYSYVLNNPLSYTDPSGYQFAPVPVSYQETTTGYEVTSLIDAFSYSSISISWGGGGGFGSAAFASTYKRDNITVLVFSLFTSFGGGYGGGGIDGGGFGGGPTITYSITIVLVFSTESIVSDAYQVHVVKDRAMPVGVNTGKVAEDDAQKVQRARLNLERAKAQIFSDIRSGKLDIDLDEAEVKGGFDNIDFEVTSNVPHNAAASVSFEDWYGVPKEYDHAGVKDVKIKIDVDGAQSYEEVLDSVAHELRHLTAINRRLNSVSPGSKDYYNSPKERDARVAGKKVREYYEN